MARSVLGALLCTAILAGTAAPIAAQRPSERPAGGGEARRMYTVVVTGGQTLFDKASGLQDALHASVEARYNIHRNIAIGPYLMVSRPLTDETYFPLVRMAFGDTIYHLLVNQQVTMLEPGIAAIISVPVGPFELQGTGGLGIWLIAKDPQRSWRPGIPGDDPNRKQGPSVVLGGALAYSLGDSGGLRIGVRSVMLRDFDREFLSTSDPLLPSEHIPHPRPNVPAPKSTINNLRLEAGFHFSPGGGR